MTAITRDDTLTKDDLKAMRKAETVHFHTHQGRSWLVVELQNYGLTRVYTAAEQILFPDVRKYGADRSREIPVSTQRLEDYSGREGDYHAFASYCPREVWATIVAALRPGDVLGFHWVASNNSDNMTRVGYHHDQLRLIASDTHGDRKNNRTWIVADQVGPDNSARMVQREWARVEN